MGQCREKEHKENDEPPRWRRRVMIDALHDVLSSLTITFYAFSCCSFRRTKLIRTDNGATDRVTRRRRTNIDC